MLAAGNVPLGSTQLFFKKWTRVASASINTLYLKVELELDGIPAHAWHLSSAYQLLSSSCWIEKLNPETANKSDMSAFRLTVWTDDLSRILAKKKLWVAELEPTVVYDNPAMER